MSYSLSSQKIQYDYSIDKVILSRSRSICDLGVIFDPKLSFAEHINAVVAKAFRTLGFIIRNCRDFSKHNVLLLLYNAYVRSRLEYAFGSPAMIFILVVLRLYSGDF